jgi:hypothetical protein
MWIQEQWVDEQDSTIMFHTHAHTHTTSNNIGGFFVFCILNLLVDYVNGLLKRVLDCLRLYLFFKKSTVVEEARRSKTAKFFALSLTQANTPYRWG